MVAVVDAPAGEITLVDPGFRADALEVVHPDGARTLAKHGSGPHFLCVRVPQHTARRDTSAKRQPSKN